MEEQELLLDASEQVDSILLLSKLAAEAIENNLIEKPWDLYLLLNVIKKLSKEALGYLRQIGE